MIHIIWSGKGYLVAVFTFGFSLAANLMANSVTGNGYYWDHHKWPLAASLFLSAITCWFVGGYFYKRKARVLVDKQTGREFVFRESHTFFFIPIIWWGPILCVWSVIAYSLEFVKKHNG
jgi:hypothetical protein